MAINTPSEIEQRARMAAERRGMDPDAFVVAAIENALSDVEGSGASSGHFLLLSALRMKG